MIQSTPPPHLESPILPRHEHMLKLSPITTYSFKIQIWVPSTTCCTESRCCACRWERATLSSAWTGCSSRPFIRYVSAPTWTPMDGWYPGGSQGWFGSILSVDSPPLWATECSWKAEPISVLCSKPPLPRKGLASLQPATTFCLVPSLGPAGVTLSGTSGPYAQSHRTWGPSGQ